MLSWLVTLMAYLAALTPPLVVCAGFLIGLALLLRHQLAPKNRADRTDEEADAGLGPERDSAGGPAEPAMPAYPAKPANPAMSRHDANEPGTAEDPDQGS